MCFHLSFDISCSLALSMYLCADMANKVEKNMASPSQKE
jgi:hypothetical protein